MNPDFENDVIEQQDTKDKIDEPGMWKAIIHNDDYTTMEFVVFILIKVFNKDEVAAFNIMMDVHTKEKGIAGIYSKDITMTKVKMANDLAEEYSFPLKCTAEKE
jgi:ATP-dependent Clp protease adaptor protein ClpS